MDDKNIPFANMVEDIARVLQEFNEAGSKYGVFVLKLDELIAEGGSGRAKITLAFNPAVLHECIAPKDGRA
jgi:hypothetical protein